MLGLVLAETTEVNVAAQEPKGASQVTIQVREARHRTATYVLNVGKAL
jgi:hypothetical protein